MARFPRTRTRTGPLRVPRVGQQLSPRQINLPDLLAPILSNLSPGRNEENVSLVTDISFTVQDPLDGKGVSLATLDVIFDGYQYVNDGVFSDGYSGTIVANGNGYDVLLNLDGYLDGYSAYSVDVNVADNAGNELNDSWTFNTDLNLVPLPTRWYRMRTSDVTGVTLADQVSSADLTIDAAVTQNQAGLLGSDEAFLLSNSATNTHLTGTANLPLSDSFTIAFLFRADSAPSGFEYLLRNSSVGSSTVGLPEMRVGIRLGGTASFVIYTTGTASPVNVSTAPNGPDYDGTWNVVIATWDGDASGGTSSISINGHTPVSTMVGALSGTQIADQHWGGYEGANPDLEFDGLMDEIAVWEGTALTAEQQFSLYLEWINSKRVPSLWE